MAPAAVQRRGPGRDAGLTGLKGGHSGCDIHLQRGNAVCLLARALWAAHTDTPFRLARLEGGSAHNAIPREAFATVVAAGDDARERVVAATEAEFAAIRDDVSAGRPGHGARRRRRRRGARLDAGDHGQRAPAGRQPPHGVEAMSYDIPDLVETSNNVATVRAANGSLVITTSSRSSADAELEALRRRIRATAELAGAAVDAAPAYPGWKPDLGSELLKVVKRVHASELGVEPDTKAIHAGLECGIIGRRSRAWT